MSGIENQPDIDNSIKNILKSIADNLTPIKIKYRPKNLSNIPTYLWTQIFEKHFHSKVKSIYLDENNNFVDNFNTTIYLYSGESAPLIYKINLEHQPYCILCDTHKLQQTEQIIISLDRIKISDRISSLHVCNNICNNLALKYYMNEMKSGSVKQTKGATKTAQKVPEINLKFLQLRYTKNRLFCLYMGSSDTNSVLSIMPIDIIQYIMSIYLLIIYI